MKIIANKGFYSNMEEFLDEFFRLEIESDLDEILYKEENIND